MVSIISAEQVIMINYGRYGHDLRRLIAASTEEQGKQRGYDATVFRLFQRVAIMRLGVDADSMEENLTTQWKETYTYQVHAALSVTKSDVGNYLSLNFNAQATQHDK